MKNIVDIYESLLTKTSIKSSSLKDDMKFLSLEQFDNVKYRDMFDLKKLERVSFVFANTNIPSTPESVSSLIKSTFPLLKEDHNALKFYGMLLDILKNHGTIIDSWWYYYKDNSAETCDVKVLKPTFKHGKQYKGYTSAQEKQRSLSVNFFDYLDNSELYMPLYYDGYVWWIFIPKGVSADEYELLKNYMTLLTKYNK